MFKSMINPDLSGKKILLVAFLLTALASAVFAEDIDREKIMPKKLIYSELPNDYPKEICEYFEASYKYHNLTESEIENLNSNEFDPFSKIKILNLVYFEWLARNSIPGYFGEFQILNSPNLNTIKNVPLDNLANLSHRYSLNKIVDNERILPSFTSYLIKKAKKIANIKSTDSHVLRYIWVKAMVLNSEFHELQRISFNLKNYSSLVKLKILDSTGMFPFNEIIIFADYVGVSDIPDPNQKLLTVGNEYIIPINWNINDYEGDISFDGKVFKIPFIIGSTRLTDCMPIGEDGYAEYFDYSSTNFDRIADDGDNSNWIERIFQTNVTFKDIKFKINEVLNQLRNAREGMEK